MASGREGGTTPYPCLSCQSAFPLCWGTSWGGMRRERRKGRETERKCGERKKGRRANKGTRWERHYGGVRGTSVESPEAIFLDGRCGRGSKTEFVCPCAPSTHSLGASTFATSSTCVRWRERGWERACWKVLGPWSTQVSVRDKESIVKHLRRSHRVPFMSVDCYNSQAFRHLGSQLLSLRRIEQPKPSNACVVLNLTLPSDTLMYTQPNRTLAVANTATLKKKRLILISRKTHKGCRGGGDSSGMVVIKTIKIGMICTFS